jgi:hypothetical protein
MNISKPKIVTPLRPLCPHCGKPSYSRGGVHPQCSFHLAGTALAKKRPRLAR